MPLSPGSPSRGYIPNGTEVREGPTHVEISEPGRAGTLVYENLATLAGRGAQTTKVKDVFVTGEVCPPCLFLFSWHACLVPDATENLSYPIWLIVYFCVCVVSLGPFCVGTVQLVGPRETMRWVHESLQRIRAFLSFLSSLLSRSFLLTHTFSVCRSTGTEENGCTGDTWWATRTGTCQDGGAIRSRCRRWRGMRGVS